MSLFTHLDDQLGQLVASWNIYSTLIFGGITLYVLLPLVFYKEPDTHPLLLARQSSASRVRHPGESATFRSLDTPHGYPLRTGLNVKDPAAPKWTSGRDGDLRDIWKRAKEGPVDNDGKSSGDPGIISTVLGKEQVSKHDFTKLSSEISSAGKHLSDHGGHRIAIYLSNSVELLVTLFSCAFYGLTPILIPQEQPVERLAQILKDMKSDTLVVGAGVVPLEQLMKYYSNLKQVIWVVPPTSRHMDWTEVSEGEGGKADIATWHEIIEESCNLQLPTTIPGNGAPPNLIMISENELKDGAYEMVELTQKNLVAAMSAQIAALPRENRLGPSDTLMPLASLTDIFPLTITLTALFCSCFLAFVPTSGPKALYSSAFQGIDPTIIIAHPKTLSSYCENQEKTLLSGHLGKFAHSRSMRSLESGTMPKPSVSAPQLRLIYTYDRVGGSTRSLTTSQLSNLRVFTGARTIYAWTDAHIAGAVCQTNMLDYQSHGQRSKDPSHLGPPLSCLELKLKEADGEYRDEEEQQPRGRPVVSGPAVAGGEVMLQRLMVMTDSNTLAYLP